MKAMNLKAAACAVLLLTALCRIDAAPVRLKQQRQQRQQNLQPGGRANGVLRPAVRRSLVQDAIFRLYFRQFQQDDDFSPETRGRVLPFLDRFLQDRFDISERRVRALNELRQAVDRNAPDDELNRLKREIDSADAEFQANHEKFLSNVDPLLNPRQQAKVRLLQEVADKRIRQALETVQNPNGQRPAPGRNVPAK